MTRFSAGLITGLGGAVLIIVTTAIISDPTPSILIAILAGIAAGVLVARNPKFAAKTGNAGALAALIAGSFLFVGVIVASILYLNSASGQQIVSQVAATVTATVQATNGSGGGTQVSSVQVSQAGVVGLFCFLGLLNIGLSTAAGAITGAIAGRNSAPPRQMPPQISSYTPYTPPQSTYSPPGYGSQQLPSQDRPPQYPGN